MISSDLSMHINLPTACIDHFFVVAHDAFESILSLDGVGGRVNVGKSSFRDLLMDGNNWPVIKLQGLSGIEKVL